MPIADARHSAGLSKKELAESIGVPLWTMDRLERGDEDPRPHLDAIAEATGHDGPLLLEPSEEVVAAEKAGPVDASDPREVAEAEGQAPTLWVRNIVLGAIVALVTVRFFTEDLTILPRSAKLVDVPILLVFLVLYARAPRADQISRNTRYLVAPILFFAVCAVSLLVNSGRTAPAPSLLFIYGFLSPIVIFHLVRAIWPTGQARALVNVLVGLACVEFATVAFIDFPEYLENNNPDVVSGTFGENAYQLVFFLLMCTALVATMATTEHRRLVARLAPLFFAATAATILLAQYRAILLTAILTMLVIGALLGLVRMRGAFAGVLAVVAFGLAVAIIPSVFPELKLNKTLDTLSGDPGSYVEERLSVGEDVLNLYTDKPGTILIGSGPGTFSSRAWETFADDASKSSASLGVNLPFGGVSDRNRTDVALKYTIPRLLEEHTVEGSFALSSPYASYYALLAEVGVFGFLLLLAVYGRALVDSVRMSLRALRGAGEGDPLPGILLASVAGFFVIIQMAILENWWEVTRVTFILWIVFAIATKEYDARYGTDGKPRTAVA